MAQALPNDLLGSKVPWVLLEKGSQVIQSHLGAFFKVLSSSLGSELICGLQEAEAGTLRARKCFGF